jgi:hypothetical protein
MKTLLHCATCPVWVTGSLPDCTCFWQPPWRIRKEPGEAFPWRIWRLTDDMTYEPLIRAASFLAAVQLVHQVIEMKYEAVRRENRA